MSKAKIASKNNPEGRGKVIDYMHNGKKIKPVKVITADRSILAAEYESGEVVKDADGNILSWRMAKS